MPRQTRRILRRALASWAGSAQEPLPSCAASRASTWASSHDQQSPRAPPRNLSTFRAAPAPKARTKCRQPQHHHQPRAPSQPPRSQPCPSHSRKRANGAGQAAPAAAAGAAAHRGGSRCRRCVAVTRSHHHASSHPDSVPCTQTNKQRWGRSLRPTGCRATRPAGTQMRRWLRCSCTTTRRRAPRTLRARPPACSSLTRPALRPQMRGLRCFPALRRLFVAQQTLAALAGLEACPLLEARARRRHPQREP